MSPSRIRYSLEYIQTLYETGEDRSKLENLIRAFRGIQDLDPKDANSFFRIAGYHGEPFREEGATDPAWWGGYCWHETVLFPTWHRAYLLRLEDALRSIPGCQDVTLPFWDELANRGRNPPQPIPSILTSPQFELDGRTDNPLYSYKLQEPLVEKVEGASERYSKHKDYETVRYPLSGLVGTKEDRDKTTIHNLAYQDPAKNTQLLNENVANWLEGTVQITPDDPTNPTRMPDTYSVYARYMRCLEAPNFTVFSNTTSQEQWIKDNGKDTSSHFVVSLESPHNAVHLAVGGFYQKGQYNSDNIIGANGDMGDNETAGFDPIFYFHHCFIDYVFATWQRQKGLTKRGSLKLIKDYPGTILKEGQPHYPPGTVVDMTTALIPFERPSGGYYDSNDMTDFENDLDYTYHIGSLDPKLRADPDLTPEAPFVLTKKVHNINRAQYSGSFVIRLYAQGHDGQVVEVGRDPILSRWSLEGCRNCMSHLDVESYVPIDEILLKALQGPGKKEDIRWWAQVQTRERQLLTAPAGDSQGGPKVDDL
ncbi:putative tyrosinase [Basidiobolus meristosporus CBS 931.73]|uniref:tyrosinase n=1 Tax=Basidiobolus meristosporus CBS 931.73 TaxID=1314790 RepID=A0A1Y1WXW1_9FUNG|nr:putative tyrosinase [Basidiobolus meristosporus CBS 931.73]ORY05754.1 putative tyrosinase [Basidiobolus meristosporus CBS 931.73]|eukprot:ORX78343.1 putative tyrosinase [Basidiobolus meristosporus CBS 931.73]